MLRHEQRRGSSCLGPPWAGILTYMGPPGPGILTYMGHPWAGILAYMGPPWPGPPWATLGRGSSLIWVLPGPWVPYTQNL